MRSAVLPAPVVGASPQAPEAAAFERAEATPATNLNLFGILGAAAGLLAYGLGTLHESRSSIAPSLTLAIAAWAIALCAIVVREPTRRLRISDPGVLVLLFSAYYFLWPAVQWGQGKAFWLEGDFQLNSVVVARVQQLHAVFLLAFGITWAAIRPKLASAPLAPAALAALPRGKFLLAVGLLPILYETLQRLATTGSFRPTADYGEMWFKLQDNVTATRSIGGSEYIANQILGKLWFLPLMALGLGLGLTMTRLIGERRWTALALFHAMFPVLMYLNPGGRSAIIGPYIIALVVADSLVGPLQWKFIAAVTSGGVAFFNFYGVFRGVQTQQLSSAIEATQTAISATEVVKSEESAMLVKEAYTLVWVDSTGYSRGISYFTESTLSLLPQQIVPEKTAWMNSANFLSRELLGRDADYGAGVAGAVIADGYMIYRHLGVAVLALVYACLLALAVRAILIDVERTPLYRHLLLAVFASQCFLLIRGDLLLVLNQIIFYLLLPAGVLQLLWIRSPALIWQRPVRLR